MGTTESNVDHAASGQTVAGDSGELTFTYAQGRFASEGKDWESPVVTNMAASVSADAGNAPAGSITNTGTIAVSATAKDTNATASAPTTNANNIARAGGIVLGGTVENAVVTNEGTIMTTASSMPISGLTRKMPSR